MCPQIGLEKRCGSWLSEGKGVSRDSKLSPWLYDFTSHACKLGCFILMIFNEIHTYSALGHGNRVFSLSRFKFCIVIMSSLRFRKSTALDLRKSPKQVPWPF